MQIKKERPKKPAGGASLAICGSGLFPSRDMTVGSVKALARCRSVFYVHSDHARVARELKELDSRIKLRPIFRGGPVDIHELWAAVKKDLAAGHATGYLTYGNPMLRGEGLELSERCLAENFPVSVFPGVSSIDAILSAPGILAQAMSRGFTLALAADIASGRIKPDPRSTLVIMGAAEELNAREFAAMHRVLLERLGPGRRVFCVRMDDAQNKGELSACSVACLPASIKRLPHKSTLLLPYFASDRENRREMRQTRLTPKNISRTKYSFTSKAN